MKVEDIEISGATLILSERQRQISEEGWTPAHDDKHDEGQLSKAAVAYAIAAYRLIAGNRMESTPAIWPWAESDWKPSGDPLRNLEKAGALIAAEIDRLLREREED